jgi:hypothetical protein
LCMHAIISAMPENTWKSFSKTPFIIVMFLWMSSNNSRRYLTLASTVDIPVLLLCESGESLYKFFCGKIHCHGRKSIWLVILSFLMYVLLESSQNWR